MTTFLTKKKLTVRAKQTNRLGKLHEQLKANAEFNKVSEISFEDAMKRQYKPLVEATDSKPKPLLAIKGSKKEAIANDEWEDEERITNLPMSVFESYITRKDSDDIYGIVKAMDDTYYLGREMRVPLTVSRDRKSIKVSGNKCNVTSGLMEVITSKSPDASKYTNNDHKDYRAIVYDAGYTNVKAGYRSRKKKWLSKNVLNILEEVVTQSYLPSNPLSFYNMLNLRLAASKAGNTGLKKKGHRDSWRVT